MTDVRVLIVDDQPPFRDAVRMVVEMTDGFVVVAEAEDGEQAVALAAEVRPDLVLMDVQMPGIDGLEATRQIMELHGPPHVLVMSTRESGDYRRACDRRRRRRVPPQVAVLHGHPRRGVGDRLRDRRFGLDRRRLADRDRAAYHGATAGGGVDHDRAAHGVEPVGHPVESCPVAH